MTHSDPFWCEAWVLPRDGIQRNGRFVAFGDVAVLAFKLADGPSERSIDLISTAAEFRSLGSRRQFDGDELSDLLNWDLSLGNHPVAVWAMLGLFALIAVLSFRRSYRRYALFAIKLDTGEPLLFAVAHAYRKQIMVADRIRVRCRRPRRRWWPF